jgi:hypothetical protein
MPAERHHADIPHGATIRRHVVIDRRVVEARDT